MKYLGWTGEQWAYAKQRHKLHGNKDPGANTGGLLSLRRWWHKHSWPDPLSVLFEGVVLESDDDWSAKAIYNSMTATDRAETPNVEAERLP